MATGRFIRKSITKSEEVSNLSEQAALFYTWCIPFIDDFGLLWAYTQKLKWEIMPSRTKYTINFIHKCIIEMIEQELVKVITLENKKWLWFPKFHKHQTLKKDRNPQTYLENGYKWDFLEEIGGLETFGNQMEIVGNQMETPARVIRIEEEVEEEYNIISKPQADLHDKEPSLNDLIKLFEPVNPNYADIYKNKTQRKALEELVKKHGAEKIVKTLQILPATIGQKYAPVITTPLQLKNKLGNLIAFVQRQQQDKIKIAPAYKPNGKNT